MRVTLELCRPGARNPAIDLQFLPERLCLFFTGIELRERLANQAPRLSGVFGRRLRRVDLNDVEQLQRELARQRQTTVMVGEQIANPIVVGHASL